MDGDGKRPDATSPGNGVVSIRAWASIPLSCRHHPVDAIALLCTSQFQGRIGFFRHPGISHDRLAVALTHEASALQQMRFTPGRDANTGQSHISRHSAALAAFARRAKRVWVVQAGESDRHRVVSRSLAPAKSASRLLVRGEQGEGLHLFAASQRLAPDW